MLNVSLSASPAPYVKGRSRPRRRYRSSRRHFRGRQRSAVLRAITAAEIYRAGMIASMAAAAAACGSNVAYVRAALVLLKSEDFPLLGRALAGHVSLPEAAREVTKVAELVAAYRAAA